MLARLGLLDGELVAGLDELARPLVEPSEEVVLGRGGVVSPAVDVAERPLAVARKLPRLEAASPRNGEAQIFIETPYRNQAMLAAVVQHCRTDTRLWVAADLTTATESIETATVAAWKRRDFARYAKRPAIFILQAPPTGKAIG